MIKTFNVDIESIDECNRLINILKSHIGNIKHKQGQRSKNDSIKIKFDACYEIINTDITDLYEDINFNEARNYYVYVHCDPTASIALKKDGVSTFGATMGMTHLPFYVGKGTGNRAFELDRNETHRKVRQKLKLFDKDIKVTILKEGLTEKEALMLESKLIDIFGLISIGGRLVNLDEGIKSSERKQKYNKYLKELNSFYKNSV